VLKEFNGGPDHVHWLVNDPPKLGLSELVNASRCLVSADQAGILSPCHVLEVGKSKGHRWAPTLFRRVCQRGPNYCFGGTT
jgi:REP element-mobilizing transposase RayT